RLLGRSLLSASHAAIGVPEALQQGVRPRRDRFHLLHDPAAGDHPIVEGLRAGFVLVRREASAGDHARECDAADPGGPRSVLPFDRRATPEGRDAPGAAAAVPPSGRRDGPRPRLLDGAPRDYRYAVEFRHSSWMRPEVFDALRRREVALVWNEVQYLNTLPEITADFVYLRFIGDRSLSDLGRLQIDRTAEMEKWAARLRSVQDRVARAFVLFNNHFAGFGPACADQFRRILGLPGVDFAAIRPPAPRRTRPLA